MHHAKFNTGEGFCLYNDVAFTASYLLDKYHLKRVMVLDTDAHAGNGTAEYFYNDPRVLFVDVHQDPGTIYPGTGFAADIGTGAGLGKTINIPLPVNAGNDSYKYVFEHIIEPVTREFRPEIIIRNGGSDPHFNDGLTSLGMTLTGFKMMGEKVRKMAEICDGKEIDLIASGYHRGILPYAWLSMLSGLAGFNVTLEEPSPIPHSMRIDTLMPETIKVVNEVKTNLKDYWRCLR
jgi:acetoin utilization protein AcuC